MQTKLTLRLEERLIARAKACARQRGVSLSQLAASLFAQLPAASEPELSPWTRKLRGIAAGGQCRPSSDEGSRRAQLGYLSEKHR